MTGRGRLVRAGLGFAAVAALALVPAFGGEYSVVLFTKIVALGVLAMSLDLLLGYTGLVSLGHAAYFGVGAYAAMLLAPPFAGANLLVSLPASAGAAALFALATGALAVRTSGLTFIMVTLAFGQMAYYAVHDTPFFGGSDGKILFARPKIAIGGVTLLDLADARAFYLFALALLVASFALLRAIVRSPFGRVIQGIKANEARMQALGYPTYRYKLASFTIAGGFAGIAGFLAAYQSEYVSPALFGWRESGLVLMMVILGGSGTLVGPVLGALVMVLLQELLSELTPRWMLPLGLFIVLAVLLLPRGLAGLRPRLPWGPSRG